MKKLAITSVTLTLIFTLMIVFTGCGCFMSAAQEYAKRGAELFYEGRFEEAIVECNKAIELNPNLPDGYGIRAWIYNQTEQYDLAIPDFTKALELDPNYVGDYADRAWAYVHTGQFDLAMADCNKAIELDPDFARAYMSRALAYKAQDRKAEAIADFEKFISLSDNPEWIEQARSEIEALSG